MNRTEYHVMRRKKYAEVRKNRVDAAYEYYCALSDEDKLISEFTFAHKLAKHLCVSIGIARVCTTNLIAEYNIEFCKYKKSSPSFGFTGHRHSAKTKAAIAKSTIERNAERVIMCKEQGINYRNFKQDADKQIDVANFCNNTRINSISSDNIIV